MSVQKTLNEIIKLFNKKIDSRFDNANFPFSFNDNIITTPVVEKKHGSGGINLWQGIIIAEIEGNFSIKELIKLDFNQPFRAYYISVQGKFIEDKVNKPVVSEKTIPKPKNIGKLNQTTVFTQSLLDIYRNYQKKIKTNTRKESDFLLPMLLGKYENVPEKVYLQPKLDGIRCLATLDKKLSLFTRTGETFEHLEGIKTELPSLLENAKQYGVRAFDGEIYLHGIPLEELSGAVRNTKKPELSANLEFHIFDFVPDKKINFEDRYEILNNLFYSPHFAGLKYVKLVNTYFIDKSQIEGMLHEFLRDKYEGVVIRTPDNQYEIGKRSKTAMKLKPVLDKEYTVIGYTDGKGKNKNAVIWILGIGKYGRYNQKFTAVPKMPLEERKKMFQQLEENPTLFDEKIRNLKANIEFHGFSKRGVPTQPRMNGFRTSDGLLILNPLV